MLTALLKIAIKRTSGTNLAPSLCHLFKHDESCENAHNKPLVLKQKRFYNNVSAPCGLELGISGTPYPHIPLNSLTLNGIKLTLIYEDGYLISVLRGGGV